MTDHLNLHPHKVTREERADGSILLKSGYPLGDVVRCTGDWLHHWANLTPDAVFLAERSGAGWRQVTFAETLEATRAIASHLLSRGLGAGTPILILSGNGIDHGLLTLAAQYVGVPTVPVAEQYSLIPAAHARLAYVAQLVKPALVFTADAKAYAAALALDCLKGLEVIASDPAGSGATRFDSLLTPVEADLEIAHGRVGPETVAKILLTSGSTSDPKGVLTTQRMMCTNQAQLAAAYPFVQTRTPRMVDWLPWNHVFGGSMSFNLMLSNGGSLYIDDGKPAKGLFDRTVENLGLVSSTISLNVPVGFAQLVTALRADDAFCRTYFSDLDMIFYAGASLPQQTWTALEELAKKSDRGMPLITSGWGLTETAPGALLNHQPARAAGMIGVPVAGLDAKLVPEDDARFEIRVRGDNVLVSYLDNPTKTRAAFDEEGFFISGDAVSFVDPTDPSRGLRFEARISEDFKLMTGTWVRAAALRLDLLGCLSPLAADVIITGHDREAVGVLIVPNMDAIVSGGHQVSAEDGVLSGASLEHDIAARLRAYSTANATGSAGRITCAMCLAEPPSMGEGEITAKGNINFARLLQRRSELVARLYDPKDSARISI